MKNPRVLVTGCQGYIGTVLVPYLIQRDFDVVGLDAGWFATSTLGSHHDLCQVRSGDLRDLLLEQLDGMDAVVHLAALSNDPLGNLDPQLTFDINHLATVRLATLARQAGIGRFVFSSSCSTYGKAGDEFLDESAEFHPVTAYGESKVRAERDLATLVSDDFCPVFLRNATAYGYSPRLRLDLVVNDFVASAICRNRLEIRSDGSPWRPLVHVEDICCGIFAALTAPRDAVVGRAFNIGRTEDNYRVRDLAQMVQAEVKGCQIHYAPGGAPDARCYRVNCDFARHRLPGYQPTWDVPRGIADLRHRLQSARFSTEDMTSHRFVRLKGIRQLQDQGILGTDLRLIDPSADPPVGGTATTSSNR